ncbi:glycosyltransferase family 2 protein [Alteromonas sp. ASW11-130]|uniref:glycosyltransferase family 2 protein n=1 Tax=Alteromonas sp. ASW11-130 TaxID=3015775 RepID=UPI002241ACBF|nr:glycosyltransferase family A protein [Alteromonas sp. ASW11-130]MCW8090341.1 glycosyltransferase family 2 protein [Alteromonas sp. ASW11-130]
MKLSVLVPVYNLEHYIGPCLKSICEQVVNFDYEVIVCDDASTDNSPSIISSYASTYPQIKPILKDKNGGLPNNMRTLLSAAKGEYIAYLDGDDLALPGKLQKQVNYLQENPDCSMVYHESDMFDSDSNESLKLYSQEFYNWQYIPQRSSIEHLVKYGTFMQASSVMFKNHSRLTDTVPDNCNIILDYPFYILNAGYLNAHIDFLPEVLGRYRVHQASFGAQTQKSATRREQCLADIMAACELARQFGVDEEIVEAGVAHHQFATALFFLFKKNFDRFNHWIVVSAANQKFFNDKHAYCWQLRAQPEQLLRQLRAGKIT